MNSLDEADKDFPGENYLRPSIVEQRHRLLRKALSGLDGLQKVLTWQWPY